MSESARNLTVVDFGNGWNLTRDQWCQLHLLEWLYEHANGQPDHCVTIDQADLARPYPGDFNPAELLGATFDHLYREWLVHYVVPHVQEPRDVPSRVALTRVGAAMVQEFRRRREDPAARRPAARDAVLRWVYDRTAAGEHAPQLYYFGEGPYARFLTTRYYSPGL